MTKVEPGMSKYEVVDVLGPPLETMTTEELLGDSWSVGGQKRRAPRFARLRSASVESAPGTEYWLYLDVPTGRETNVTLVNGVVTKAVDKPYDGSGRRLPDDHDWIQGALPKYFAKVESTPAFAVLVRQPGWQRLRSSEVCEWVQNTHAVPRRGELSRSARRFGEVDVIVSYCDFTSTADPRATYFPNGYFPVLSELVTGYALRPKQRDLAHWILGRRTDDETIAHLAFVPAAEVMGLMPWDLLSAEEQTGGSASS